MLLRVPCKLAASGSHVGCTDSEFGDAGSAKHDILIPRCLLISGIVLAALYMTKIGRSIGIVGRGDRWEAFTP